MEKDEVIRIKLKNYEEQWNKMLRQLVLERMKTTASNKFKLEEIEYWSQYFEISILIFMFQVLQIKREDYRKVLKKQKRQLESEVYTMEKNKILERKSKIYKGNRNLNIRNYYNKQKIMIQAEKQKINIKDFVIRILGKSYMSYRYVTKDEKGKKRIYIGRYNNASLPATYVEENQQELRKMIFTNIMRVSYRRNIPINGIAKKI